MADAYIVRMAEKPLYERNFLPEITELSPEQLVVLRYPLSKDLLVSGPAGSGKTVLAIHRYNAFGSNKGELLTFTNMLKNYIAKHLNSQQITVEAKGIFEYVKEVSPITVNQAIFGGQKFADAAERAATWSTENRSQLNFIIADETQDFHNGHLGFIANYAERLTLFADDAQTLYDHGHSTTEIIGKMRLDYKRKIERKDLTDNYRNQLTVAQFANAFYKNRNDEPLPSAVLDGATEKIRIFIAGNEFNIGNSLIEQVRAYVNSMPDKTPKVGILVQNNDIMDKVKEVFVGNQINIEYANNGLMQNNGNIFSVPDPIIMTMVAAKGLEFDYVVIPYFDYDELEKDRPSNYEQIIFTAITRARRSASIFIMDDQENFLKRIDNVDYEQYNIEE